MTTVETRVAVVGAGATGLALAAQLRGSGLDCIVIEREQPGSGATFRSAGVLHSGARYAVFDTGAAKQCLAAHQRTLEFAAATITCQSDAYYLLLKGDDLGYADRLTAACDALEIPTRRIGRDEVLAHEPRLRSTVRGAVAAPDYVQDPILLVRAYTSLLEQIGVRVLVGAEVERSDDSVGSHWRLSVRDVATGSLTTVRSEAVVVAAGAWTPHLLKGFGVHLAAAYVKGSMFVSNERFVNRVVCRCAPPEVPDTAIPCHDSTLIGSTWRTQTVPEPSPPDGTELEETLNGMAAIFPNLAWSDIDHGYSGVRVLVEDVSSVSMPRRNARRDFFLRDHSTGPNAPPLVSVFGGKLTLHDLMATSAASHICQRLALPFRKPDRVLEVPGATAGASTHLGSLRRLSSVKESAQR